MGPQGWADLSIQPDTSLHCETTEVELVYHMACLFTPQFLLVLSSLPTLEGWPG